MAYVITELCIRDGACVEVCPVTCIHTTPEAPQFYIDPAICIECEQCVVVCPAAAVFLDIELPDQYLKAEEDNATFFRETKDEVEQLSYHTAMAMIHEAEASRTTDGPPGLGRRRRWLGHPDRHVADGRRHALVN